MTDEPPPNHATPEDVAIDAAEAVAELASAGDLHSAVHELVGTISEATERLDGYELERWESALAAHLVARLGHHAEYLLGTMIDVMRKRRDRASVRA